MVYPRRWISDTVLQRPHLSLHHCKISTGPYITLGDTAPAPEVDTCLQSGGTLELRSSTVSADHGPVTALPHWLRVNYAAVANTVNNRADAFRGPVYLVRTISA